VCKTIAKAFGLDAATHLRGWSPAAKAQSRDFAIALYDFQIEIVD